MSGLLDLLGLLIIADAAPAVPMVVWWLMAFAGLCGSALYSGMETGVYQLNRVRLHLLVDAGDRRATLLERMVAHPNRVLGTLLIGNNVVNYLASLGISGLLAAMAYSDWQIVGITALILTPMLFVFGEVLPKDLFRTYTDRLTYLFARFLWVTQKVVRFTGVGPLVDGISWLLSKALGTPQLGSAALHPRRVVTQLMKEGIDLGLISAYQSEVIDRVLHPTERHASDAMVPWGQVQQVQAGKPPEAVWAIADRTSYARLPLVDGAGRVAGVLSVLDVLRHGVDVCPPLDELARPMPQMASDQSIREALRLLRDEHSAMGLVVDGAGRPLGIVTVKDLVEPITGELTAW